MDKRFEEVVVLSNTGGRTIIPITSRVGLNGRKTFSFSIQREFYKDNEVMRTPWLFRRDILDIRVLLDDLERAIEEEEERDRRALQEGQ